MSARATSKASFYIRHAERRNREKPHTRTHRHTHAHKRTQSGSDGVINTKRNSGVHQHPSAPPRPSYLWHAQTHKQTHNPVVGHWVFKVPSEAGYIVPSYLKVTQSMKTKSRQRGPEGSTRATSWSKYGALMKRWGAAEEQNWFRATSGVSGSS